MQTAGSLRLSRRGTCAVLGAGFLTISVAAKAAGTEDQVQAAYAAWDAAFNKKDAKAVAAFYTEGALLLPANHAVIKGPPEIEKFFAGLFANGATGHKLTLIEANGDSDMTVAAAKWAATLKGQPIGGVATHEFRKQPDGTLKLKLHIFN